MAAARFKVLGQEYELATDLTVGEMCDAEREFGSDGVRLTAGLIWVSVRRSNPKVTVEDIRALPLNVFQDLGLGGDDAGPPELTPEKSDNSGESSSPNGDPSDSDQKATGDPG